LQNKGDRGRKKKSKWADGRSVFFGGGSRLLGDGGGYPRVVDWGYGKTKTGVDWNPKKSARADHERALSSGVILSHGSARGFIRGKAGAGSGGGGRPGRGINQGRLRNRVPSMLGPHDFGRVCKRHTKRGGPVGDERRSPGRVGGVWSLPPQTSHQQRRFVRLGAIAALPQFAAGSPESSPHKPAAGAKDRGEGEGGNFH